jgi:hypothetical protein
MVIPIAAARGARGARGLSRWIVLVLDLNFGTSEDEFEQEDEEERSSPITPHRANLPPPVTKPFA